MALGGFGGGSVATVFVDVEGDLTKFKRDVSAAGTHAEKQLGGKMGRAGKVAGTALAGGAALAIGKGVSAFVDFEKGMNEVFTLIPDAGQEGFDKLTDQTKDFAKEFGVLPNDVIPALYDSLSAGVPKDNVFAFLEDSNKFAKAGAVDLGTAVDGLTSTVNAYGMDAEEAGRVSDVLFTAVKLGKTTVQELSDSMFQVAPIAASFGVSIEDVSASFATLTAQGTPTSVAATQLKGAISELGKEGTKASDAFLEISGQTFPEFIENGGDLAAAAGIMKEGADDLGVSMVDLFGSIEAGQAFVGLSADQEKAYENFVAMQEAAGATDVAFEQMEKGIAPTIEKLQARFEVLAIELGETLAPTIETVGGVVLDFVEIVGGLPGPLIAIGIGVLGFAGALLVLATPILRAITLIRTISTLLAANPYVILLAATVILAYVIYTNWESIKNWIGDAAKAIEGFLTKYISEPAGWLAGVIEGLPSIFANAWGAVKSTIADAATFIMQKLGEMAAAADRALGPIDEVIGAGARFGGSLLGGAGNLLGFDDGGVVPGPTGAPRLVLAHAGETILPTHKNPGAGGGGVVVNMTVSSEVRDPGFFERQATEIARVVEREQRRRNRGGGKP